MASRQYDTLSVPSSSNNSEKPTIKSPSPSRRKSRRLTKMIQSIRASSSKESQEAQVRSIQLKDKDGHNKMFCNNSISTSKYTFINFLPVYLFSQFRKPFNIYFIIIIVLQQIPDVSPTGKFNTLLPFIMVLTVAGIKEIIEDYGRHKRDRVTNNSITSVYSSKQGQFVKKLWTEVMVGDIVRVVNGQFFPADLVLLSSSEPQGMCYIETANLDGETNLKIRQALAATTSINSLDEFKKLSGGVLCEGPNRHLYSFNGTIDLQCLSKPAPMGPTQLLLRGAKLRNTHHANGIVVYTGLESKLMKNAHRPPLKMSQLERVANKQIWLMLVVLLSLSACSAFGYWWWNKMDTNRWYLVADESVSGVFLSFMTFIVLYNNLVPISLLVTLEVVKFIQAIFINSDLDMYYSKSDTPALARTSNLNEELGQVKYIFSDKTGTLTQNQMVFKKCSVAGVHYGMSSFDGKHRIMDVRELSYEVAKKCEAMREFLIAVALCHTIVPEQDNNKGALSGIKYQASSPDELALIEAARKLGCVFVNRTPEHVIISAWGEEKKYELLNVLEFNSTRKRMSVIVRDSQQNITLYCKGADNVIYDRLSANKQGQFTELTSLHIQQFAIEGLRTLCFGRAVISPIHYNLWNQREYYPASTAVVNRDEKLDAAYESIEKDLHLIGASAIEDKLQDGVPEAISTLLKADIKMWVLTGDKLETAINIAHSCKLIDQTMEEIILQHQNKSDTHKHMKELSCYVEREVVTEKQKFALVVTGTCLHYCLQDDLQNSFLDLALTCNTVICCRVSPLQKAEIVEMVKTNCRAITLAIGDGANDVGMIQAAHVGVGISGFEGLQAANSSDYSIAQFAYLVKLLLVHGAWNHFRVAKCILYCFHKNICLYLIELWYLLYNGFSGQIIFDPWIIILYNMVFTVLPPFTLGLFEKLCSAESMRAYPQLYSVSQTSKTFNTIVFWLMCANATLHSALLYFIPFLAFSHDTLRPDGKTGGYLYVGIFVYSYTVVAVCLKAGLETSTWTVFSFVSVFGSMLLWFAVLMIYSYIFPWFTFAANMYGQGSNAIATPTFWLGLILVPTSVLFKDMLWKIFQSTFMRSVMDEVKTLEKNIAKLSNNTRKKKTQALQAKLAGESSQRKEKRRNTTSFSGFAFSQEEKGPVSQANVVRAYLHRPTI